MIVTPVTEDLDPYMCEHCAATSRIAGGLVTVSHASWCPLNPAIRAARSAQAGAR